jgi:hypothetical protein
MDLDNEIQEIDLPVIIRSRCKKYCRKILKEELDPRFCHHSKRHNNYVENLQDQYCIDAMDVSAESSHNLENVATR